MYDLRSTSRNFRWLCFIKFTSYFFKKTWVEGPLSSHGYSKSPIIFHYYFLQVPQSKWINKPNGANITKACIQKDFLLQLHPCLSCTCWWRSLSIWWLMLSPCKLESQSSPRRVFFFSFIFISWRLITLQYCNDFCHTLTWISHGFTCVPHRQSRLDAWAKKGFPEPVYMYAPAFIATALQLPKDKAIISCNHERVTGRKARGLQIGNRLLVSDIFLSLPWVAGGNKL